MRCRVAEIILLGYLVATPHYIFCAPTRAHVSLSQDEKLKDLVTAFALDYKALEVPAYTPDYQENFKLIKDLPNLQRQKKVFEHYQEGLRQIDSSALGREGLIMYKQLGYELSTNRERLNLEFRFRQKGKGEAPVPMDGLFRLPDHTKWYRLYLRQAASRSIAPIEVKRLGEREVKRVTREIKRIQKALGFEQQDKQFYARLRNDAFFLTDERTILAGYEALRKQATENLKDLVEDLHFPPVKIAPIPQPDRDAPPGYYNDGVFYFNFIGGRYNKRAMDWLFLHEAIPGHHYQLTIQVIPSPVPEFKSLFSYSGFDEGWGAYCEDLGKELGFYKDIYQELGKWEWDLVRSVRLVMDVGIHFQGWSKAQALSYWKEHILNQDEIALREVDRITRWPGQVVSYKVGEARFLELKAQARARLGANFDPRTFHKRVLSQGSLPLDVLPYLVSSDRPD